jgi:hypothetical protein
MRKSPRAPSIIVITFVCLGQIWWFGSKVSGDIDFDGMTYTALAADLKMGKLFESINAFRSPLISWLIAAVPRLSSLHAGKVVTVLTFLAVNRECHN